MCQCQRRLVFGHLCASQHVFDTGSAASTACDGIVKPGGIGLWEIILYQRPNILTVRPLLVMADEGLPSTSLSEPASRFVDGSEYRAVGIIGSYRFVCWIARRQKLHRRMRPCPDIAAIYGTVIKRTPMEKRRGLDALLFWRLLYVSQTHPPRLDRVGKLDHAERL